MSTDPADHDTLPMFPKMATSAEPKLSGKVFVVQETVLNLVKATRFGELVSLLPSRLNITMSPAPVIRTLRQKLKDFDDSDYILPIGDPVAIGLVFLVASDINRGKFRALKWDKQNNSYYVVTVDLFERGR